MLQTLATRLDSEGAEEEGAAQKEEKRLLPEDWDEREKALKLAKLPARIPVVAVDEIFRSFGLRGLSEQEREEGLDAWAALFWELGLFRSGKVLVALWMFGVSAPRFADWVEDRRRVRAGKPTRAEAAERRAAGTNGVDPNRELVAQLAAANAQLAAMRAELDAMKAAQRATGLQ